MKKTLLFLLVLFAVLAKTMAQKHVIINTTGYGFDHNASNGIDADYWNYIQQFVNLSYNGQDAGVTAVRLHVQWHHYEPTLGNYQGAKLAAAVAAIKNLKPGLKVALHFGYLRPGTFNENYLADNEVAQLPNGTKLQDNIGEATPSVFSSTAKSRFFKFVGSAMGAISAYYNDLLYVEVGNSSAEEFIIPIKEISGVGHKPAYYEQAALDAWRTEYLPCRYPGQSAVTWDGNSITLANAPAYTGGNWNSDHGREYHRFAAWGLMKLYKEFRDTVKSRSPNTKVLYFTPGFGTPQSNVISMGGSTFQMALSEFDGIYTSDGVNTGDTWRKIMPLDVLKGSNPNKIAAIEFDPIDLGQVDYNTQPGIWPNMVSEWFARAFKHGADYIHLAMKFHPNEIPQLAQPLAAIKATYLNGSYTPPARQNPITKNLVPDVFTGEFLYDTVWRNQGGDNWSVTDASPKSVSMNDAGYWQNIWSCNPPSTCDYNISATGPSGSVNTNANITLNSTCSGQCSGVSYSWSGTGISGNNTSASVSFPAPSTAGTYTYTLTTSKNGCTNKTATVSVTVTTSGGGSGGAYTQEFDNFFNGRLNSSYNGEVTAIVGCGDNILYTYSRGFTLDQPLRIMSLTKWTTAAIIMMLEKENKLKITDSVGKYIPSFTQNGKGHITIEQLLAHTSGIPFQSSYDDASGV